jgi:hypothetical protein
MSMSKRKLHTALIVYMLLAIPGFLFARQVRWVLWLALAGLAVKTWIAWAQSTLDEE